MKINIDGATALDMSFESIEALVNTFRSEELAAGRELPRFSWEALALAAGSWLLGKAAEEAFEWVVNYRRRITDHKREEASAIETDERHKALMRKLDSIAESSSVRPDLELLRRAVSTGKVKLEIVLETSAEADLKLALQELISGAEVRVVATDERKPAST